MAITSNRIESIILTGDTISSKSYPSAANSASPGSEDVYSLLTGANTILVPTGGTTVKAATIIPPAGNLQTITLKGITGDTGVGLSKLDPTTIAFDTAPASFVLTVGGNVTGLRIIWS